MRSRPWSIVATFVVLYTIASLVILGGTLGFLLRTFERHHRTEQRRFLEWRLHYLTAELESESPGAEEQDELSEVRALVDRENEAGPNHHVILTISSADGANLLAVGEVSKVAGAPFPRAVGPNEPPLVERWIDPGGTHYILTSLAYASHGSPRSLHLALDTTSDDRTFMTFRGQILGVLVVAALLTALSSAFIAWRGLRPLSRITGATEALDVSRLDEPFRDDDLPRELLPLAAAFSRMQHRLRESFERLLRYSEDLAHELRTPINNVMGMAEVALRRERPADEYRETLESILEEHERLRRMIDGLLFLSRAENPSELLAKRPTDLRQEAEDLVEYFQPSAEDKGVALEVRGKAVAQVDRDMVRRAFDNLLANAVRHTPPGGTISIEIRRTADAAIVEIVDSGEGIAKEYQSRIFDRFVRIDGSRSESAKGSGLGLAIVKSIMDLHDGSVEVESRSGRTAFRLRFPDGESVSRPG